jgi:hypothetical protein
VVGSRENRIHTNILSMTKKNVLQPSPLIPFYSKAPSRPLSPFPPPPSTNQRPPLDPTCQTDLTTVLGFWRDDIREGAMPEVDQGGHTTTRRGLGLARAMGWCGPLVAHLDIREGAMPEVDQGGHTT